VSTPPVNRSAVAVPNEERLSIPMRNYLTVVDTLKANNGAEAKAIRAMFGGDKALVDRFLAVAFSAMATHSDVLADAEPLSLVNAIKEAASLGLEPFTDDAAIIVYNHVATLQPMWRGYLKRIRNSREVVDLDCQLVYTNDVFELSLGTSPSLRHIPAMEERDEAGDKRVERGDYRGCYAWALMPSGTHIIEWMTVDEINYVRDTWGNKKKSNWTTSWGEMARKTVIRRLAKRLPSAAVDKLLAADQRSDEAAEAQVKVINEVRDQLADVRNLALRAVGDLPALTDGGARTNEEPTPEATPSPSPTPEPTRAPDPEPEPEPQAEGVDPDVAAAMAFAEEQRKRQLRK